MLLEEGHASLNSKGLSQELINKLAVRVHLLLNIEPAVDLGVDIRSVSPVVE